MRLVSPKIMAIQAVVSMDQAKSFAGIGKPQRSVFVSSTQSSVHDCLRQSARPTIPFALLSDATNAFEWNGEFGIVSIEGFNELLGQLCRMYSVDEANILLSEAERVSDKNMLNVILPNEKSYVTIMNALLDTDFVDADKIEGLLERMRIFATYHQPAAAPKQLALDAVARAWSRSRREEAGERCEQIIRELWVQYKATGETEYIPLKSTYIAAMVAWSSHRNVEGAMRHAKALFESMERLRIEFPHLSTTAECISIIINAWSNHREITALSWCEKLLSRVETLYFKGRTELQPEKEMYGTLLDALAKSNAPDREIRAEKILNHLVELSSRYEELSNVCMPDQTSYEIVLGLWARSSHHGAAQHADAILYRMENLYFEKRLGIQPDASHYNAVLMAWSKSKETDALPRAEAVLARMEQMFQRGNKKARPNIINYNILINILAKSNNKGAGSLALEILERVNRLSQDENRGNCRPDIVTYTSCIDALAKESTLEASEEAIKLLAQAENDYIQTGDSALKPNIRTYTAVINAISRSRQAPERAEVIISSLEQKHERGQVDFQPDVVCYDALINAIGWSTIEGRTQRAYEIFQRMLNLYETGKNVDVKPDIITCNAVLNAAAFEDASNPADESAIVHIALKTYDWFQSRAPDFGWPNHITYASTLLVLARHLPQGPVRTQLTERVFVQCCESGHVSTLVVKHLSEAASFDTLVRLLGPALFSTRGEPIRFGLQKLPADYCRFAPRPNERRESRPGRRSSSRSATRRPSALLRPPSL